MRLRVMAIPALFVIAIVVALGTNGSLLSMDEPVKVSKGESECCNEVRYYELKLDRTMSLVRGENGNAEWESVEPFSRAETPPRKLVGDVAEVVVDCRTTSTNEPPFSGRKTCSDGEVHRLPPGFVFVENEVNTVEHSSIGSTSVNISFEDRVEIVPGTGIMMARTMRVQAHARSPSDTGARGHIHATVKCRFVGYQTN